MRCMQAAAPPSLAHQPQLPAQVSEGKGAEVGRACALLVAHTRPDLPIKFIEVRARLGGVRVSACVSARVWMCAPMSVRVCVREHVRAHVCMCV